MFPVNVSISLFREILQHEIEFWYCFFDLDILMDCIAMFYDKNPIKEVGTQVSL